jgi:hypothetical protein
LQCDKSHTHKPWGYNLDSKDFSTREETDYPDKLCAVMATILKRLAVQLGVIVIITAATAQRRSLTQQNLYG